MRKFCDIWKKIVILILLFGLVDFFAFGSETFPFNSNLSQSELEKLNDGGIVLRNIGTIKKICMEENVCQYSDEILRMFRDLNPSYLAEIIYKIPLENNSDLIEQAQKIFSDYSLYREIIYTDDYNGERCNLFRKSELIDFSEENSIKVMNLDVRMDMLSEFKAQLLLKEREGEFFFSQINQSPLKWKFITAVGTKKMRAGICCFQNDGFWYVYALGGIKAPRIPFITKEIDHQFIGRIQDFAVFYIQKFNINLDLLKKN